MVVESGNCLSKRKENEKGRNEKKMRIWEQMSGMDGKKVG